MPSDVLNHLGSLRASVGPDVAILTNPDDAEFQGYAKRWSDIDRETPAAIVLPLSEEQIQKTVWPSHYYSPCFFADSRAPRYNGLSNRGWLS
jgi:hypothetical protein